MKKLLFLLCSSFCIVNFIAAQNVGIGTPVPTEKLQIDSGSLKIGKAVWNGSNIPFLKFGDGNFLTIGEEEADDKLTIKAKELFIRPSTGYSTVPLSIQGTNNYSHFFIGTNEDTYIRAGKNNGNVILNDITGGKVGVGVFPTRAILEQYGSIGTTAAIFGGDGAGISLQKNWPVIGFNHYFDGVNHKSIGQGYSGVFGVNQINGNLYYASWPFAAIPNANLTGSSSRFVVSRFGKLGLGIEDPVADLHINQRPANSYPEEGPDMGITMEENTNAGHRSSWNIHVGTYVEDDFTTHAFALKFSVESGAGWSTPAAIAANGQYFQYSDKKLKKDITYLGNEYLDKIKKLKPATYHFNYQNAQTPLDYGFIAQDVEQVFPEFVGTFSKNKMISYSSFIPILTKGMQEQQQQIEALQKENTDLKQRVEKLEKLMMNK